MAKHSGKLTLAQVDAYDVPRRARPGSVRDAGPGADSCAPQRGPMMLTTRLGACLTCQSVLHIVHEASQSVRVCKGNAASGGLRMAWQNWTRALVQSAQYVWHNLWVGVGFSTQSRNLTRPYNTAGRSPAGGPTRTTGGSAPRLARCPASRCGMSHAHAPAPMRVAEASRVEHCRMHACLDPKTSSKCCIMLPLEC